MHWPGLATFWFGEAGPVTAVVAGVGRQHEIGDVFLRGVVPVVLLARGYEALHASAVMLEDGAVVGLCAVSGTGKSTLALAMTACGARHFADDTVIYRPDDGAITAYRLPAPARVDVSAKLAARLGSGPLSSVPPGEAATLRRVYLLSRDPAADPRDPRFEPVARARRFEALLPHAHPFDMADEGRRRAFISRLLEAAGRVDMWACAFAASLEAIPVLAERLYAHACE